MPAGRVHRGQSAAGTVLVVLAIGLAACGSEPEATEAVRQVALAPQLALPATLDQLTGPWQPRPYTLDANLFRRIADACAKDMEVRTGPVVAVVIDVRGEGVAVVRLDGQTAAAACDAIQIRPDGTATGAGGGWSSNGRQQAALGPIGIADLEISTVEGGDLTVTGWLVRGRAGPGIASVVVQAANGPPVLATLTQGWFSAWWPRQAGEPAPNGPGRQVQPQLVVRGYDVAGTQVAEATP